MQMKKQDSKTIQFETDQQVISRIATRFDILHDMTKAVIAGDVRAMIVTGPPGVGKSYGVEKELDKASMMDSIAGRPIKYEVVKGAMTALGLYAKLYEHADANHVLVFDDCDSVLMDELSLNILKAALDSGKKRVLHWNADSSKLRTEGIPNKFEFKGGVIFITNVKFENVRSKKLQDHLEALQSRCHYLDLTLDTMRDKFLRIKQIVATGELFGDYDLSKESEEEVISFMDAKKDKLREVSLRMALKIADLTKVSSNWSMENRGHFVRDTTRILQYSKNSASVGDVKVHQLVVLPDMEIVLLLPLESLEIGSCQSVVQPRDDRLGGRLASLFPN